MGGADLPPKLRAVMEDNRMLKDQVRKYKQKVSDQERSASTQQKQMLVVVAQMQLVFDASPPAPGRQPNNFNCILPAPSPPARKIYKTLSENI